MQYTIPWAHPLTISKGSAVFARLHSSYIAIPFPKRFLLVERCGLPSSTRFLGPTRRTTPNGISTECDVFPEKKCVHYQRTDRQTDRQTNRLTNQPTDRQNEHETRPVRTGRLRYTATRPNNSAIMPPLGSRAPPTRHD